jgi:hypothetical protein
MYRNPLRPSINRRKAEKKKENVAGRVRMRQEATILSSRKTREREKRWI